MAIVLPTGPGGSGARRRLTPSMRSDRVRVELSPDPAGETLERPRERPVPEPSAPFRILLLGDFSGDAEVPEGEARTAAAQAGAGKGGRAERRPSAEGGAPARPVPFDRDDLDRALRTVAPALRLRFPGSNRSGEVVRFRSLEDFHPDRLYERLEVFRKLRSLRRRLASGDADEDGGTAPRSTEGPEAPPPTGGDFLDRVVDETSGGPPRGAGEAGAGTPSASHGSRPEGGDPPDGVPDADALDAYVRGIVGPHLVPEPDPERRAALDRVDAAIEGTMRAVLHDPEFQALEAAWRSARFMARRIETGPRLKLYLLDVSAETLRRDLLGAEGPERSSLREVVEQEGTDAAGGDPWAVIAGLYTFGPGDLDLLTGLARLARAAGAPFLGGASLELAGVKPEGGALSPADEENQADAGEGEAWRELRGRPEARWLGLALPRILLRSPYGESTRPCEAFPFEELDSGAGPRHEDYLWGGPAAACAVLLARSFVAEGWSLRPGRHRDLDRLPMHTHRVDGESRLTPSAEFRMTERVAHRLLEGGFMPLAWIKDRPSARLVRFQSIARPAAPLAGRWGVG